MKEGLITSLILLVSLAGCTSIPISPIVKERVLVADFDSTWEAALAALKEEKIPVSSADKQSGIIRTKTIKVSGDVAKAISQGYNEIFDRPFQVIINFFLKHFSSLLSPKVINRDQISA